MIRELDLASDIPLAQRARLADRLEMQYPPEQARFHLDTLTACHNWACRHWSYLQEVGLIVRANGKLGCQNALILALREMAFRLPASAIHLLPDTDPLSVVRIAQKYIDGEKADGEAQ